MFLILQILIDKQLNYSEIDYSLVIVSQALSTSDEVYLKTISKCLKNDTFLISRESEAYQYLGSDFTVIEEHTCLDTNEKLVLLRKKSASTTQNIYFQMNDDFNEWLPSLKMLLNSRKSHQKLIIYSETSHASGIDGFVNCLRKEPGLHNTCCVAILDGHNNVPKFDPDLDVYKKQLQKNLLTNIFKNNQWGSYRRDWLVDHRNKLVNSLHSWANTLIRTNVSSLQWIQGNSLLTGYVTATYHTQRYCYILFLIKITRGDRGIMGHGELRTSVIFLKTVSNYCPKTFFF